jgi:peptidoglycan/xylan/chitin deacetylase (PgdA/CDA1 family)
MRSHRGGLLARTALGGIAVLLVAAGCAGPIATSLSPSPVAAKPSLPAATATATPTATPTPTPSPSPSPEITDPPATPPPLAGSLSLVNSCDSGSVPGAIAAPGPADAGATSFTLRVPVLMYHRIVPLAEAGNSISGLVVPPETFDAQLTVLARAGWHTITMATLATDLQDRISPPARTFVITLDDGWYDGYTYAFPILRRLGFVATFYVIAGRIDAADFLSSVQLRDLVAAGDDIGDHTMDHSNLTALGAAKLKYEVDAGAARIAQVTGYWPESLAYPSGYEDTKVVAAVGACAPLRIAVLKGALKIVTPAPAPKGGASPAPATTASLQAYETWATRYLVPRIRVTPGTKPATLLAWLG